MPFCAISVTFDKMSYELETSGSLPMSSFLTNNSSLESNDDTIEELENAIYDTNALSTPDATERLLSHQKRGIFERALRWCSALAFHVLLSKENGLTLAGSKGSIGESFRIWEEKGAVGDRIRGRIITSMLTFVRELFVGDDEKFSTVTKRTAGERDAENYVTSSPKGSNSNLLAIVCRKDEPTLLNYLKSLMGTNFKDDFVHLYASTCWMSLVASLWGTSFSKLSEVERSMLDKAWASNQVTPECRENFRRFGSEAIIAVLAEHFEELTQSVNEVTDIPEPTIVNDSSLFPSQFSIEFTPSRSRITDSGQQWEVEAILERRFIGDDRRKDNNYEYHIKWKGYGAEFNSWERFEDLNCRELIVELKRKERQLRKGNMRLLLEESILQNVSGTKLPSTSPDFTTRNGYPMKLNFSLQENVSHSRSTL